MASHGEQTSRVPGFVAVFNPIAQRLLGAGMPMGPNGLITVRGRKSGLDRTTPVAVVEVDGRRWVLGTFGDTNWVRNLRAAGRAILTTGKKREAVTAVELSREEAVVYYRDILGPYVRRIPLGIGRWMLGSLLGAPEMLKNPAVAAEQHPVFELVRAA